MIEQRKAIREKLLAIPEVAAITTRIFNGKAAIDTASPYIIIRLAGVSRPRTHDMRDSLSRRKMDTQTWEIICVSEDGDQASLLAEAIDNGLDGQVVLPECALLLFDDASDATDYKQDQSASIVYQISLMFLLLRRARD